MKTKQLIGLLLLFLTIMACKKKEEDKQTDPKNAKLTVNTTIDGQGAKDNVQVRLYIPGNNGNYVYEDTKTTNIQGVVVFENLEAGTYELECHYPGYYASFEHNIVISASENKNISTTLTYSPTLEKP